MKQEITTTLLEQATVQIDDALAVCKLEEIKGLTQLKQAIALASGMKALRAALTNDVMSSMIMPLQGTTLGFRTDKDKEGGYSLDVVRDCVLETMIRGFSIVGNEMNIIAGNAYFTKNGMERRVLEYEGLTCFESSAGVPSVNQAGTGAAVPYRGRWLLKGVSQELLCDRYAVEVLGLDGQPMKDADGKVVLREIDERIPVRVNSGQGPDAILGKARRKYMALVLQKLMGQRFGITDGDIGDLGAVETTGTEAPSQREKVQERTADLVEKRRKEREQGKANGAQPAKDERTEAQQIAAEAAEFERSEAAKNA